MLEQTPLLDVVFSVPVKQEHTSFYTVENCTVSMTSFNGEGFQVVTVEDDHTYELDEWKLGSILLRDDIKDLPVVLVSVAGAYRGGKSFLLNLFIKYLMSEEEDQSNGQWVETGDTPLTGFSWRGGSTRNTTGLLIWSEPFVRTLTNGEKVAVLLMDTQGTFDNSSSVKDNSTIFALSTLISSVQIYNLSMRIQEDHLQELELFTDYGKLIKGESGKPFQVLEFLIRDWMNPYEYKYGAVGGQQYLDQHLDINKPGLLPDMKELRQHIFASFESITCFLMPHPGLAVMNPNFKGKSNELTPDFKEGLKELASSLFSENKMKVKQINGVTVKAKELYEYFKSYMTIFNSNKVPEPTSILEATSKAGFLLAMNEAREQYETNMDKICGPNAPTVPIKDVQEQHKREVEAAKAKYIGKKKLGSKENETKYLNELIQTLAGRGREYMEMNKGKTMKAMSDARKAYDKKVNEISKGKPLFIHAVDLQKVHDDAFKAVLDKFKENRKVLYQTEDLEQKALEKDLKHQYSVIQNTNKQNNTMAVIELKQQYWIEMMSKCTSGPALTNDELNKEHEKALQKALAEFDTRRNIPNQYREDTYKYNLETGILAAYDQVKQINGSSYKQAYEKTIKKFDENMITVSEIKRHCLHPQVLRDEYEAAVCAALKEFRPDRSCDEGFHGFDKDERNILKIFQDRFKSLTDINDTANKAAINAGFEAFRSKYDELTGPSWWWLLVLPLLDVVLHRDKYYNQSKDYGTEVFYSFRRESNYKGYDEYYSQLQFAFEEYYNS